MSVYEKKMKIEESSKKEAGGDVKHVFSFPRPNTVWVSFLPKTDLVCPCTDCGLHDKFRAHFSDFIYREL